MTNKIRGNLRCKPGPGIKRKALDGKMLRSKAYKKERRITELEKRV
jgi:hypothetical protein